MVYIVLVPNLPIAANWILPCEFFSGSPFLNDALRKKIACALSMRWFGWCLLSLSSGTWLTELYSCSAVVFSEHTSDETQTYFSILGEAEDHILSISYCIDAFWPRRDTILSSEWLDTRDTFPSLVNESN